MTVTDAINTEVANVRKLLEGETSAESIKEAVSNLQKALMKIGEHLAQSGQVCNQALPRDHRIFALLSSRGSQISSLKHCQLCRRVRELALDLSQALVALRVLPMMRT